MKKTYNESNIPDFETLYYNYLSIKNEILDLSPSEKSNDLISQFKFFDTKLRLAFAIRDIHLDQNYVNEKTGNLKLCHLMLYKFNDLWFTYEALIKLLKKITSRNIQSKVVWLKQNTNSKYHNLPYIQKAIKRANNKINSKFNTSKKRHSLQNYIKYCSQLAKNGQQKRLNASIGKINPTKNISNLDITDWLSLSYSFRNNFVHNGETTVTTPELDFEKKKDLIIILFELLTIITLAITCKMIEDHLS